MFTKNIDSILKKVNKIVQELRDVQESINLKVQQKEQLIEKQLGEKMELLSESERAKKLLAKWEDMV